MPTIFRTVGCAICLSLLGAICIVTASLAQSPKPGLSNEPPATMLEQPCLPALELPGGARDLLVDLFIEPRHLGATDIARLTSNPQFKEFNEVNQRRAAGDWAAVCRFHWANATARAARVPPRVVFMGDSITENWGIADPELFSQGVLDRGISGQTSEQMLVRFWSDVVALRPRVVLILAGTNDIAGNTGPNSPQDFKNDIMSMAQIARANGIEVVLCSIPPTAAFNWRPQLDPKPWIKQLNSWLRAYASQSHFKYIDYYPLLAGPSGEFRAELSNDGVHPNRNGYRLMRALVEKEVLSTTR